MTKLQASTKVASIHSSQLGSGLILGIDPGSIITGFGLVVEAAGKLKCHGFGIFEGHPKDAFPVRLKKIGEGLRKILAEHKPAAAAIEKTFFSKNVDSITKLSHARGVCLYEIARAEVPIFEYLPTEVKASVTGHGKAPKDQVQFAVRGLLGLHSMETFDMSDALAVAIHHARIAVTRDKIQTSELPAKKSEKIMEEL